MGLDNPLHIAFLLLLLLLVFGAKRLPEMGRSLGDGMRGFRDALGGHGGTSADADPGPQPVAPAVLGISPPRADVPAAGVQSSPRPAEDEPAAA